MPRITKILIYAHDGVGYGHIAKMANLSLILKRHSLSNHIYLVSGYPKISSFLDIDEERIDFIKIPQHKDIGPNTIRSRLLETLFSKSSFDYIIVDFFLFGTKGELVEFLKKTKTNAKIILTIRGVIFSKEHTLRFWKEEEGIEFVNQLYDHIVCFCDQKIIDVNKEYFEHRIQIPIKYLGYIYRKQKAKNKIYKNLKQITIDFGGGYGCDEILLAVIQEIKNLKYLFSIVVGEYFLQKTKEIINALYSDNSNINIYKHISQREVDELRPDAIVGCGGYNTTSNAIFNNIPIILIPKTIDEEATIHAHRLKKYSSVKVLSIEEISELTTTIGEVINSVLEHNLKSFDTSDIYELLN